MLLHVVTEKGHGFQPAAADPVYFHTPAPFKRGEENRPFDPEFGREVVHRHCQPFDLRCNATGPARHGPHRRDVPGQQAGTDSRSVPTRFFDTGICESHAVAFAAGQAKAGLRPIVDIYSTFLQRSFDQLFQEVALQDLPVTFMLDRAGLTGPDGPTHHGVFDMGYLRLFPNFTVMAPGDADDLTAMLDLALSHGGPTAIRYPKATAETPAREPCPLEYGRAAVVQWGTDGMLVACGTILGNCLKAAAMLRDEGFDVGVVNARFVKPLDTQTILRAIENCPAVLTVEEAALMTGFGSAVLEACNDAGVSATHVRRLGIPDRFIEHAERGELLAELSLDPTGIAAAFRALAEEVGLSKTGTQRRVS